MPRSVIIGGSTGIGLVLAEHLAARGDEVVVSSRDAARAEVVARTLGPTARGIALQLADPEGIADGLSDVGDVDNLVITAVEQVVNSVADFNLEQAVRSVTVKLVGYTEVVRVLHPRFTKDGSVVLFGGLAKDRPYPGSTMVTTFNAGVSGLIKTLAIEIAPHRINALHPGVVGDSPKWRGVPAHPHIPRTPIGRLVTMNEIAAATEFLLGNTAVNAHDLIVDGGLLAT
jgi:NAD(P)-dependent dehydrogenase (short-subunit alcohol dehydrogenase family)